MIDLKFSYDKPCGVRVTKEYGTIMDFTDAVENGDYCKKVLSCGNVAARFFENPLLDQHLETVEDLYKHCISIMAGK